ncbi:hypothetical protein [Phytoactinopolyspora limicola]|uniref:DUF7937 domain-containing protein n=1 Tax=Phytoactinopolyspora limicola TaxID=2715536 RepID=UPI00140C5ED8|nr:hypothetical protein [Phytoactinopolyspora limicola]
MATPAAQPAGGAAAPGGAAPGEASAGPPGGAPPAGAPAMAGAPVARQASPFAAIPVGDYVRDALALLLLLIPLGMAWDFDDKATGKVYVILVTLLSILSLSLPYLKAASVLPPNLLPAQLRLVRLAANAPYLIVVLVTIVLGYVGDTSAGGMDLGDGVGVGLVIGLGGALLAAQGRASEQGTDGDGQLWRTSALGMAGLGVIMGVLAAIFFLVDMAEFLEWSQIVVGLLAILFFVVVPLIPVLGANRGEAEWRDVAVVIGAVGLMASFWALAADETIGEVWSLRLPLGSQVAGPQLMFWLAIGVVFASAGVSSALRPKPGAARWIGLARRTLEMAGVFGVLAVILLVFQLFDDQREAARGTLITVLVISLIVVAAALVGRTALINDARGGRSVAVAVAGVLVIAGIVIAAVMGASDNIVIEISAATFISGLFIFAVVVVLALTAPPSVRSELGQFTLGQGGPRGAAAAPAQQQAAQVGAQGAATGAGTSGVSASAQQPAVAEPAAEPAGAEPAAEQPGDTHPPVGDPAAAGEQPSSDHVEPEPAVEPEDASGPDATLVIPTAGADPAAAEEPTDVPVTDEEPAAPVAEPEVVTASGYTAAIAADPNTPLQTLADIAAKEPSLRPHIASNPSTYPELLDWLGQLGDPAVDEALRRR